MTDWGRYSDTYYSGRHGLRHKTPVSPYRRLLDEAEANGWRLIRSRDWRNGRLEHEDGSYLSIEFHNGWFTGGVLRRAAGGRGLRLTPEETKATIKGARCTCQGTVSVFPGEPPVVYPEDSCPFRHADIRHDLKWAEDLRQTSEAWREHEARVEAAEALRERRSA